MRIGKQHLFRLIVVAGAALAAAAPTAQAGQSPDDRAVYRGSSALAPARVSPDDRSYYRGISVTLAPRSLGPDDRAFARSVGGIEPRTIPAVLGASSNGFDWEDALIGGTLGLAVAFVGAGAVLIAVRHRRRALGTA